MMPARASNIVSIPIMINDVCKLNIAENNPNANTPIISPIFPTNSPTPVIVPSSPGLVQSEIYAEITGRINDNHSEIPNVITMIFRKPSLNQSKRKNNIINRNFLLLPFPVISHVKKSIRYGSLIAAKIIATCDRLKSFATDTIGIKINPT